MRKYNDIKHTVTLTNNELLLIRRALQFRSDLESDYGRTPTAKTNAMDNLEERLFVMQKYAERNRERKGGKYGSQN